MNRKFKSGLAAVVGLGLLVVVVLSLGGSSPPAGSNREYFIFPMSGNSADVNKGIARAYERLVGTTAVEGDLVHVVVNHELVSSLTVPSGDRRRRFRDDQVVYQMRLAAPILLDEQEGGSLNLDIPELGDTVRSLSRSQFPKVIILAGSPIYESEKYFAWNMTESETPTAVALKQVGSPFAEAAELPAGTVVRWIVPPKWGKSDYHQKGCKLWWSLYFETKGGKLTCLTEVPAIAFDLSVEQDLPPLEPIPDERNVRRWDVNWIRVPIDGEGGANLLPQPVEEMMRSVEKQTGKTLIAINWIADETKTDMDLRIRSKGYEKELSWEKPIQDFGILHRDVKKNGTIEGDGEDFKNWEMAEINHSDLNQLEVWVNVFEGGGEIKVRFFVVSEGEQSELVFTMNFDPTELKVVKLPYDPENIPEQRGDSPAWEKIRIQRVDGKIVLEQVKT